MKKIVFALLVLVAVVGMTSCNIIPTVGFLDGKWECRVSDNYKIVIKIEDGKYDWTDYDLLVGSWVPDENHKGTIELVGGDFIITTAKQEREYDSANNSWGAWSDFPTAENPNMSFKVIKRGEYMVLENGGLVAFKKVEE